MQRTTTLLDCAEAFRCIGQIADPTTRNLVNMAITQIVKKAHIKNDLPKADLDMVYLVHAMRDFFSQHDVIARTLEGERVGAFFDDP